MRKSARAARPVLQSGRFLPAAAGTSAMNLLIDEGILDGTGAVRATQALPQSIAAGRKPLAPIRCWHHLDVPSVVTHAMVTALIRLGNGVTLKSLSRGNHLPERHGTRAVLRAIGSDRRQDFH